MGTSVGPSPTSQLVQTIFNLKELQLRQQAAALAQQQFGLQQQSVEASIGATHEQQVAQLGQILQNTQDPQALLEHVPELSAQTGYSQGLIKTLIQNTKPSVETTRAGVVARGVASAGSALEQPAASVATTGQLPGQVAKDSTEQVLANDATSYYKSLDPSRQAQYTQEFLQRTTNGQTPGQAAIDMMIPNLPPERKKLAAEVGLLIAPSANQDAQIQQGYAEIRLRERQIEDESAKWQAEVAAGLQKLQKDGNLEAVKMASSIIHDLQQFTMDAQKNSSSFTPFGKLLYNTQINGQLELLRQLAPNLWGPKGTNPVPNFPNDATVGAATLGGAIWNQLKK